MGQRVDFSRIFNKAHKVAIYGSPVATGNLRYNGIKKIRTNFGGIIRFSEKDAYYFWFLHYGKGHTDIHKGFLTEIRSDIATVLQESFLGMDKKYSEVMAQRGKIRFSKSELDKRGIVHRDSIMRYRLAQAGGAE